MSRYHYSPYATNYRRAPRWPWVLAAVIVVAVLAAGAVLAQGRILDGDVPGLPGASNDGEPTAPAAAQVTSEEEPATAPPETARQPAAGTPAAVASPPVAATPALPEAAREDPEAARQLVEAYAAAWSGGDYATMFDLISAESATRAELDRDLFALRYTDIAAEAGLTNVTVEVTGDPNLQSAVPVAVTHESTLVGSIEETNAVPVIREEGQWRIDWSPSLIFADLGDGCVQFDGQTAERGMILDRNGEPLALDAALTEVGVVPNLIDGDDTLQRLSELIDMPVDDIQAAYADADPGWYVRLRALPEERAEELINATTELPGVQVRRMMGREYPYGAAAAHVTGWVQGATEEDIAADDTGTIQAGDWIGQAGIESGANELLTGTPGGALHIVDCLGRGVRTTLAEREPVPAKDVILTIDIELQIAVFDALAAVNADGAQPTTAAILGDDEEDEATGDEAEGGAEKGSSVILDPRTGEVLAMASYPSFDPNGFVLGFNDQEWERLNDEAIAPLRNRATTAGYPSGSIFKVITAAAAMEHLGYTAETEIDCPSSVRIGNQEWDDWTVEYGSNAQGMLTLHSGLVRSCNTVFYQLGIALDDEDPMFLPNMARSFGLGAPTGIPNFPEIGGTVPDPEWKLDQVGDGWATGDAVNLAIGQGYLLATPLQMANVYATIANGGTLLQPYIVDQIRTPGSGATEQVGERTVKGELPLSQTQVQTLQTALRDQTSNEFGVGSAQVFGDFQFPIAGKTGTAQVDEEQSSRPHSWFAAYGPAGAEAKIASIVMIESIGEGVSYAAPATRQIYEDYLTMDLAE